jgi:hypothetical protein
MLLCVGWHIQSQPVSFFEIVPDLGALRGQSQGLNIMGDSLHVYVLGDMIDTQTLPGDTSIRPFYARFDYQGHITAMRTLYDPNAPGEFYMLDGAKPILKKAGTVYFYGSQLDEKSNFHACMIELNEANGDIQRYACYPHPPSADSTHGAQNYNLDQNGIIVAYHDLYKERGIAIREIDTSLHLAREILVESHPRGNHPHYIERDTEFSYTLVGSSTVFPAPGQPESKFFYMRVDTSGQILEFKLVPGISDRIINFSDALSFTVLRTNHQDWILSGVVAIYHTPDGLLRDEVPFSISVSPRFDTLHWQTYLFDPPGPNPQFYFLTSACKATDESGFVVSGHNVLKGRSSFLKKLTFDGDTLWTRHYIPSGWTEDRLSWSIVEVVQPTPYNTFVMAGKFFDRDSFVRRAWILHVDSVGCLVPGCDRTVDIDDPAAASPASLFKIAPNPASGHFYILQTREAPTHEAFRISLYDMQGRLHNSGMISPIAGGQYIFPLDELPPGLYAVKIENPKSRYIQTEKLIIGSGR